jgi:uncharacterized protein (TIGR03435 family)
MGDIASPPPNLESAVSAASVRSSPSIFTALQDKLGLKLVLKKIMVEILAIDHIEKMPTEN